jgi:hypothetical protein
MQTPIAAFQIRRFDAALADGPIAELIHSDLSVWQTFTAYPLNSDRLVCGPYALVAANKRAKQTIVCWRDVVHRFETGDPGAALHKLWKVFEYKPTPQPKSATLN